jgi:hypothetical protein
MHPLLCEDKVFPYPSGCTVRDPPDAHRPMRLPDDIGSFIGFRCALSVTPPPQLFALIGNFVLLIQDDGLLVQKEQCVNRGKFWV